MHPVDFLERWVTYGKHGYEQLEKLLVELVMAVFFIIDQLKFDCSKKHEYSVHIMWSTLKEVKIFF